MILNAKRVAVWWSYRTRHQSHVAPAERLWLESGQHQPLSSMARASIQQEDKMAAKKLGKNNWITYGRNMGFGLGFNLSKGFLSVELGFWYLAFEF